jgi:hypothetical protein
MRQRDFTAIVKTVRDSSLRGNVGDFDLAMRQSEVYGRRQTSVATYRRCASVERETIMWRLSTRSTAFLNTALANRRLADLLNRAEAEWLKGDDALP